MRADCWCFCRFFWRSIKSGRNANSEFLLWHVSKTKLFHAVNGETKCWFLNRDGIKRMLYLLIIKLTSGHKILTKGRIAVLSPLVVASGFVRPWSLSSTCFLGPTWVSPQTASRSVQVILPTPQQRLTMFFGLQTIPKIALCPWGTGTLI